jgi:hypothetical protein
MTMTDAEHPNPDPSPSPTAAGEPDLQNQVDDLLDDVEALTREALGESESDVDALVRLDAPTSDPTKEIIADDVGLASESPLVQDGERKPVEDVAADVDQELDQMERLISGIGATPSSADSDAESRSEVPAPLPPEAPDAVPPTTVDEHAESDLEDNEIVEDNQAVSGAAADAGPESTPPVPAGGGDDASLEPDHSGLVGSSPATKEPPEPDALIAGQIPSTPQAARSAVPDKIQTAESAKETTLDHDLDALLESTEPAASEAQPEVAPKPPDPQEKITRSDPAAPEPVETSQLVIDLESIPIWRVVKLKLKTRSITLLRLVARVATNALVWLLERIDAKIGSKLPPAAREIIGYCALATLGMSLLALLIFLI